MNGSRSSSSSVVNEQRTLVRVGNYAVTGKTLGVGHFAKVVEGIHKTLNVKVAIKIINLHSIDNRYTKKNLKREAVILSQLSHPGIISLFEVFEVILTTFIEEISYITLTFSR